MIVYSACCTTIYVVTWLQSTEWAGLTTGHNASTLSDSGIFSLSVCFPGTPSPHAISRLRVSSIRRHQTTVMTQPTPSSPAMGPRLKTQDNNNNNNKRGGGDMGDYPCTKNPLCPRMDVARVRGGAGGEPHTDGWITCCCLKRPPRQEKNIPVWFFFLSIQWPHNQVRAPALHARIPLPSLPHTPACAYVACARALISPASRRGSRLARQSS